jgi:hypothetical protein
MELPTDKKDIDSIENFLKGIELMLIHTADYLEETGVCTYEEIQRIDALRHIVVSKIMVIKSLK